LACQANDNLPKVKEANLSQIDPASFAEEEWFIPYYLKHFAAVANSVVATGENRGYFSLSVWRGSHNHHTYNARIMEGILSLVWFYCTDRPWNIYYSDPALKKRIEASLQFWCKIQNTDGRFSEYEFEHYYATFNSGKIITEQQRYGLGLVWTRPLGTVFQSQSKTDEASWGTKASGSVLINSSEKDEIKLKNFESNLENKKCKVIEISTKNRLIYEFVFE